MTRVELTITGKTLPQGQLQLLVNPRRNGSNLENQSGTFNSNGDLKRMKLRMQMVFNNKLRTMQ